MFDLFSVSALSNRKYNRTDDLTYGIIFYSQIEILKKHTILKFDIFYIR